MPLFWAWLALAAGIGVAAPQERTPLDRLLTEKEYRAYQSAQKYQDRMGVFKSALERYQQLLIKQGKDRRHADLRGTLMHLVDFSHHAVNEPTRDRNPKDRRAKKVRKLEIAVREFLGLLSDMKFDFPFEMHSAFDRTHDAFDEWRVQLLSGILRQPIRRRDEVSGQGPPGRPLMESVGNAFAERGVAQRRGPRRPVGDQFTEEEVDRLREKQDLKDRVDVFLEIAESRLAEVHRRMTGEEWPPASKDDETKKKKKTKGNKEEGDDSRRNPLEFFTVTDMIHAYERAIDGITVNVDDRLRRGMVNQKDLKKVLKKVNKGVQEFIPRLAPVKQMAIDQKDESLYRTVQRAERISEVALKGSQMFLGAPEK